MWCSPYSIFCYIIPFILFFDYKKIRFDINYLKTIRYIVVMSKLHKGRTK